jgi:rhamnose transport system ATP-binding protein
VLLSTIALTKAYDGVQALRGLSFDLAPGEVHALVGENGAGKSTFVRIVTGAEVPDDGTLTIDGREVAFAAPADARALGIAAIYQQPALFPDLSVAENIALPLERGRFWSRVSWAERRRRARALLDRLGAGIDPSRLVETLSLPEQQLVEIAKAVGANARILLMDEPTAALAGREVDRLFGVVDRLRAAGAGIVYISHRLDEIRQIADRVTVIRDGRTAAADLDPATPEEEIIRLMVGRGVETSVLPGTHRGEVAIGVSGLTSRAAGLSGISFEVRCGEILGIAGLVGSGRTALAETLFGLRPRDAGDIRVRAGQIDIQSPDEAIRAGIAYVPEDRRRHGVIADLDVAANTGLASLARLAPRGWLRPQAERALADEYVRRFGIRTASVRAAVGTLSGGNQQKVALARWLATSPSVLMLDEPTQGVDVGAKAEIHALIRELAAGGLAVLMISSDLPEILRLSHRVLVMRRGRVAGALRREEASSDRVMALAVGGGTLAAEAR